MIYQEFSLIPEMTVIENVFLNVEPMKGPLVDDKTTYGLVKNFFDSMEVDIEPHEKVKNLNTSDMQFVEISKAVLQNKRILLMDEPTAALEADQTDKLF
ncbi:MAG TPA: sugar ABC transporter ATP-binding protein, partial [Firmicutes bacterium]|nr:sugar ABC transporter ATP-binding protein [Bacillota bacterium]